MQIYQRHGARSTGLCTTDHTLRNHCCLLKANRKDTEADSISAHAMKTKDLGFTIGDVGISLFGTCPEEYVVPWGYRPFCGCESPHINVQVHRADPKATLGRRVFACPPVWALHQNNGTTSLAIFQDPRFPGHARTLMFSYPLEQADLYLHEGTAPANNPFAGPTLLLLMVNYFAQEKGAMLHSCGIQRNGRGMLFVGDSGAGKSTLANLLCQGDDIDVLSDERVILRRVKDKFRIYGTPWHGDGDFVSPLSANLEGICFLRQGAANSIEKLSLLESVFRLVQSSFIPHWDSRGMAFTLDFFTEVASSIPSYLFTFSPDRSVLRFVEQDLL